MKVTLTIIFGINILLASLILAARSRWMRRNDVALWGLSVGQGLSGLLPVSRVLPRWTSKPADQMFLREAWFLCAFIALQLAGIILVQLI